MRIRAVRDEDADAVAALWTEAYTGRGPGGRKTPYDRAEFFEAARRGRAHVAEEGGAVLGVVVFYPPGAEGRAIARKPEAELSRLAVTELSRGRGIGRALVGLCAELAREEEAEALVLWSRPYQADAHKLYEALGYRRRPERDSTDEDGQRLVFVLSL
ncbi:MAG: GNAT family N-acetyltransferase [Solirubrobacterales bacterium]